MSTIVSTSGPEGMKYIEGLMDEVGVRSAASSLLLVSQQAATSALKSTKPTARSSQVRDCLEPNTRAGGGGHTSTYDVSSIRRSPSPSMLTKGALLLGKGDDQDSRYFGKAFVTGTSSPGPIYDPPLSCFDPSRGISFTKAIKRTIETHSNVSDCCSELVVGPGSVGKQILSNFSTASSASFPRGTRFNAKQYISRVHHDQKGLDSPAPTAYQSTECTTNEGHGAVLCGGRVSSQKLFISRAHTVDCIGLESPGPIYHPCDGLSPDRDGQPHPFRRPVSTMPTGPSVSFSGSRSTPNEARDVSGADVTDSQCRCHVERSTDGKAKRVCVHSTSKPGGISKYVPQEPFISSEHSKVQSTANTPGPAYYHPGGGYAYLEEGPKVSFTKAKLDSGTSKAESASPGPKYNPTYDYVSRNKPSVMFGSRYPHEDRCNRFNDNIFAGKGFDVGLGRHSPGPVYDPKSTKPEAQGASMAFREEVRSKKQLFPGPLRNRYLSEESARDNLGCYSPGPKYDTRGDISKGGIAFSISRASRDPANRSRPASADGGALPTSASAASASAGAAAAADTKGKADGGEAPASESASKPPMPSQEKKAKKKAKVVLLNPKYDYLSTTKPGPAISISPTPTSVPRKRPGSADEDPPVDLQHATLPNFTLVETQYPAVSFSKNSRLPPSRQSVQPGPTQYTPNFVHVESRAPAISIGIL